MVVLNRQQPYFYNQLPDMIVCKGGAGLVIIGCFSWKHQELLNELEGSWHVYLEKIELT